MENTNTLEEELKYYLKNPEAILDNDNYMKYIIGKNYSIVINRQKEVNITPIYKDNCLITSNNIDIESFHPYGKIVNDMKKKIYVKSKYIIKKNLDIYRNVRYLYRYHVLLTFLNKNNITVDKMNIITVHILNNNNEGFDKSRIQKDKNTLTKLNACHKKNLFSHSFYSYSEFIDQQQKLENFTYIRFYTDRDEVNPFKLNILLIKLFNIIYNSKNGVSVILELWVNNFVYLLADIIYVLSAFFKKTILFSHKYDSEFRTQLILHHKIIDGKKINITIPKKTEYLQRLISHNNTNIHSFFKIIINRAMINNIILNEFNLMKLNNIQLSILISEKIDHHKQYNNFIAKYKFNL